MSGASVVPNGEGGRVGKVDQARKLGASDEVDCSGAGCTDLGCQPLLPQGANDDRESAGCPEQSLRQLAIVPCGPTLGRMARRGSGDQQKEGALPQLGRQGRGRRRACRQRRRMDSGHQQLLRLLVDGVWVWWCVVWGGGVGRRRWRAGGGGSRRWGRGAAPPDGCGLDVFAPL